jgi:hypothetical protein
MQLRSFNDEGIEQFRNYLKQLRNDPTLAPPASLLTDKRWSSPLFPSIEVEPIQFNNRMSFASWLYKAGTDSGSEIPRNDAGFWAWLSLALFDQVCPKNESNRRSPGADARHIPDQTNWQRRYRHLLANPYDVFWLHRDNPERAAVVLVNPLHKPGELTEQFTARSEIVSCSGTMALATYLYIDPDTQTRRSGASGKSARRFGKLMNQYTRTWDLPEIKPDRFVNMLPKEFEKFKITAQMATDTAI